MNKTLPQITLYGRANIYATKSGTVLRALGDQSFELDSKGMLALHQVYNRDEIAKAFDTYFLECVKANFIAALRTDVALRRSIGGTKWEVKKVDANDSVRVHVGGQREMREYLRKITETVLRGKKETPLVLDAVDEAMDSIRDYIDAYIHAAPIRDVVKLNLRSTQGQ